MHNYTYKYDRNIFIECSGIGSAVARRCGNVTVEVIDR